MLISNQQICGLCFFDIMFDVVYLKEFFKSINMEKNQIDQLLAMHSTKLPFESISIVRKKLENIEYETAAIYMSQLKDPTISLIISVVVGAYGVDRFYIGDVGLGVAKLLTCGGAGVWWLVDLFLIMDATKKKNYDILMMM